jgi:two-component system OmpR family response regulator
MRILLVEDDDRVADHVSQGLTQSGHTVDRTTDGRDGLYLAAGESYDAVVLDRLLPNVDGMTILHTMRASGDRTPVLILSALGEVDDRVDGLRAGGDDYLAKPFALSELIARLDALFRRGAPQAAETRLRLADLEVDLLAHEARRGGRRITLTAREFRILEYMLRHAGQVITRGMLLEQAWDYHFDPQTNIIDQHVSRLRRKIDHGFETPLIHTVRGIGYRLATS